MVYLMVDRRPRETEKGPGQDIALKGTPPTSDLLPPARLYRLRLSEPPKIGPPAGDQVFNI
jgi:hypothetical protein